MSTNSKSIAFLIGSGASIPVGMPSTKQITNAICTEATLGHIYGDYPAKICSFIRDFIKLYYIEYLRDSINQQREITYEDIYNIIKQIRMSFLTEYTNPLIKPFLDCYRDKLLRMSFDEATETPDSVEDLFKILDEHVVGLLSSMMNRNSAKLQGKEKSNYDKISGFWRNVQATEDFKRYDLFTLNHDDVIECMLFSNTIQFYDGFKMRNGMNYRLWSPECYERNSEKMHLYKLHGSINWTYRSNEHTVVIENLHDYKTPESQRGTGSTRPELLIGTFYKMLEYTAGIYWELFSLFREFLWNSNYLIICGYGFGDKGINNCFHEWIDSSPDRQVIVIDPNLKILISNAQPSISYRWKNLKEEGKLIEIENGIETINWEKDVKSLL